MEKTEVSISVGLSQTMFVNGAMHILSKLFEEPVYLNDWHLRIKRGIGKNSVRRAQIVGHMGCDKNLDLSGELFKLHFISEWESARKISFSLEIRGARHIGTYNWLDTNTAHWIIFEKTEVLGTDHLENFDQ